MHAICYSIDNRYAELAAVSMKSVEEHGECPDTSFVVAGRNLSTRTKIMIERSVSRPVEFLQVDRDYHQCVKRFKVSNNHWSEAIFFRYYIVDHAKYDRILYLDADTIVRGSLKPLFSVKLDGALLAAVEEKEMARHNRNLGRDANIPYFNSGVMLIDAQLWRATKTTDRLMSILQSRDFTYPDQDALNVLIDGQFKSVSDKWNAGHWVTDLSSSAIVHFTKIKPNNKRCDHPLTRAWRATRQGTAWRDMPLQSARTPFIRRLRNSISKRLENLLSRFDKGVI